MAVSPSFRTFALEQLGRVAKVSAKSMFGGVGVYCGGLFFALMDDDTLYFKVDDGNRGDFERRGMKPFMPFGDRPQTMQYYALPAEALEDPEELGGWVEKALAVAQRKKRGGGRKGKR